MTNTQARIGPTRVTRSSRIGTLAAVLALGVAGCGGGDDPQAAPEPAPSSASSAVPVSAAQTTTTTAIATTTITTDSSASGPSTTATPATVATTSTTVSPATASIPIPAASTVADLVALDRPVTLAHAGGDFAAPHSTLFAFTQAAIAGIDALEMDVMLTADGVLVVQHDDTVDRTTDSTGQVRAFTYEQLSALDNAYWFSGDVWVDKSLPDEAYPYRGVRTGDRPAPTGYAPDDFAVTTFREVAERFPDHVLDVEIKIPSDEDGMDDLEFAIEGARVLAEQIEQLDRVDSVVVVSFSDVVLEAFREIAPNVATSPGLDTLVAWYAGGDVTFAQRDVVFQAPPVFEGIEVLTVETVERARAEGFGIWAWPSDSSQETSAFYRELFDRGVDGVISARHTEAVEAVEAVERASAGQG